MTALVIVAGGKGTRLQPLIGDLPKVLAPIGGRPNLDRLIALAREFSYRRVVILAGAEAGQIERHLATLPETDGMDISMIVEDRPGGTAGCFRPLAGSVGERMLVLYGDISCDFDLRRFDDFHAERGKDATILVQPNSHMHDSDLVAVDGNDLIVRIDRKPHNPCRYYENLTNAAAYVLEPAVLSAVPQEACVWFHDVFPRMLDDGKTLQAYRSWEYLQDFGTPERYRKAQVDLDDGIVGDRRANGRTAGGLFLWLPPSGAAGDADIAAIAQYNDRRWPVILCGESDEALRGRLNDSNVYADLYFDSSGDVALYQCCACFGLNPARSRMVDLDGLRHQDPADLCR
jgi:NDP-sugar pyrophosphorylase family protein